ncbi:MAG: hypothetical protein JWM20_461 [Patescibacteria group bacterium]|nr:hypothetical protein [Patescibacteria group bacterium]
MLGLEVLNLAFGPEHRLSECTVRSVESDHGSKEVFLIQGVGKYCADPAIEQMIPCSFEGTFNLNTHALELEAYLPKKNPDY